MIPAGVIDPGDGDPGGVSYSGVFAAAPREQVLGALAGLRFTGWIGPQEQRWVLAVTQSARIAVAAGRRSVAGVARDLSADLDVLTLAVEVDRDRALRLWAYDGTKGVGWFDSDPAEDDELAMTEVVLDELGEPVLGELFTSSTGAEHAATLAQHCGADTDAAEELEELLDDELSEDVSESERLKAVLRLLGLPTWLVASGSLPRRVPGGPDAEAFTRLGAGHTGIAGWLSGALTRPLRRRSRPG